MAQPYLWLLAFIAIFDLVVLVLNLTRLRYRTRFSRLRLVIGLVLAALLITGIFRPSAVDLTDKLMLLIFALTAVTWAVIRKGVGETYVLLSLGTAGLMDWRNFKSYVVESTTANSVTINFTNYLKRTRTLTLLGDSHEIQSFIQTKMTQKR